MYTLPMSYNTIVAIWVSPPGIDNFGSSVGTPGA